MITAFSARMTSTELAKNVGTTLVFGTKTLDLGDGYDPSTGFYIVQQNGTYTFTWTLTVHNDGRINTGYRISTALMINNTPKQYMQTNDGTSTYTSSSTSTVVTEVNVGDRVNIEITNRHGSPWISSSFSADGYSSTFGGWMIQ